MIHKKNMGKPLFEFEILKPFKDEVQAAVFSREIDISNSAKIGDIMEGNAAISFKNQLHGNKVHLVDNHTIPFEGDALITQLRNVPLTIRIADCASILLYDPTSSSIANIHAGWRGLAAQIIQTTVMKMEKTFGANPATTIAMISPMIGFCCAEFSNPYEELPSHMHPHIKGQHIDLPGVAEAQLNDTGISSIQNADMCTACDHDNSKFFWSFRRDPNCGRFGTAIMLRQ